MTARELDPAALELAALYALSALAPDELAAVERDWREVPEFWAEVRSLRAAAAGLAAVGPRARPRRDLWLEIRARLEGACAPRDPAAVQVWRRWRATGAPSQVVVGAAGDFEPTDIPGIRVRRLFVDEPAGRVTMLVRMDPGTAYPAHRHAGQEECYVLEGDLEIGSEVELHAGDYQCMAAGSFHPVQATRAGCLLFLTSSVHDELVV